MESSLSLSPRGQCSFHLCLGIELPSLSLGREGSEIVGHFCQGSLSSPAPFPSATSGLQSVNSSPLNFNDSVSPHFTLLSTKYGTPPLECVPRGGKQNFKGWFKYCGFAANHLEYIQSSLRIRKGIGSRTRPPNQNPQMLKSLVGNGVVFACNLYSHPVHFKSSLDCL